MAVELTEALALEIVAAVAVGVPLKTAVLASGVGINAFYKLLERAKSGQEISVERRAMGHRIIEALERARAKWEADHIQTIQSIAANVEHRDSFRASTWLMNNHPTTRETYYPNRHSIVEHQAIDPTVANVHLAVRELSDDELLALIAPAASELD